MFQSIRAHLDAVSTACCLMLILSLGFGPQALAQTAPIQVEPLEIQLADGPVRGFLARVDLTDPRVRLVGTTAPATTPWPAELHLEVPLVPVPDWARSVGATLAINANYFAKPKEYEAADVIGLSMTSGEILSKPRVHEGRADPALVIDHHSRAHVGYFGPGDLDGVGVAVAGVGASSSADQGTLLVTDGRNTGATARVQPDVRHPRTAIGTNAEGTELIIVVVDGRQEGWSIGMTLPELADVMLGAGAASAINLDGGGSSTFYYAPAGDRGDATTNRPSDGEFRGVANALGVLLIADPDQPAALDEPVESHARPGDDHAH